MTRHVSAVSACAWLAAIVCFVFCWSSCSAASVRLEDAERKSWADDVENMQNDLYVSELVNRLRALNDAEETGLAHKRGFDFGLGRGFSATQAAKHKMGLEAAAFPGGPGRRRRSVEQALHL
ncbi:diuretic hormone class 2-like [Pollicipes pollicipes]|uniref:diuretic hormone class 2-like n=1 Tax=Pollicipes pollicipes TaxID=41117 RepID=UPI0018850884|nr:diuretic hormone class 2-like [Pollicipes pollicipes]XP_037088333.1 diuretic hormone class 2-like [Pollicipes pollicipes]XP_037088334.1 diuretic hormone class 2-like [Pollicipes pollicipes]XP_037088335.1 diuretic hormone class 2-like [Pollicipes pollicipes]XP_037088336.1 diuretic hormone class 2-like [Pollicipes pollicipes]